MKTTEASLVKVLVVEDDPIVSGDIQSTVKSCGYQVVSSAMTGEGAIAKALELKPDIVLMDIRLKGKIDGIEAAAVIKQNCDAEIIFLSAFSDNATFERAAITEPFGYLVKPFRETDLRINIGLALYKRKRLRLNAGQSQPQLAKQDSLFVQSDITSENSKDLVLRSIELFSMLPEQEIRTFSNECRFALYGANEIIYAEGNEPTSCFIVIKGRVSMLKSSPNGRELVVEILPPLDISNLIAAFEDQPTATTARAAIKSELLMIPKRALFDLLKRHPNFYKHFAKEASQRLRSAYNFMRAMAHDKVETRIAAMLTELSKRSLCSPKHGNEIQITRQELADLTGTTSETAIRVTRAMEDKGVLTLTKRGMIEIKDMDGLRDYIVAA